MTADSANLVLEQLRHMRPEIASMMAELKEGVRNLHERLDRLGTQVQGVSYVLTTGIGLLVVDMKDVKRRLAAIERRA